MPGDRCGSRSARLTGGWPASTSTWGRRLRASVHQGVRLPSYPVKVWVYGHEWAKGQAVQAGIGFTEVVQLLRHLRQPGRVAGHLRPARSAAIDAFLDRWMGVLPLLRIAIFYTKGHDRILGPFNRAQPTTGSHGASPRLRVIDHVNEGR